MVRSALSGGALALPPRASRTMKSVLPSPANGFALRNETRSKMAAPQDEVHLVDQMVKAGYQISNEPVLTSSVSAPIT